MVTCFHKHVHVRGLAGEWVVVKLPWHSFVAVQKAKQDPGAPPLDPAKVRQLGLVLSRFHFNGVPNPKYKPGPFKLEVWCPALYLSLPSCPLFPRHLPLSVRSCPSICSPPASLSLPSPTLCIFADSFHPKDTMNVMNADTPNASPPAPVPAL